MQRGVDREQMRQVVALGIHELIDPLDRTWPVVPCLDRQRWRVVEQEPLLPLCRDSAIAPHVVAGSPAGRICWRICRIEIS